MKSKKRVGIVLDDGGGIAMAVYADKYAYLTDDGQQAADDLIAIMDDGTTYG